MSRNPADAKRAKTRVQMAPPETFVDSVRAVSAQQVFINCNRSQSYKDLLNPSVKLNEVTTELREPIQITKGTSVQATLVTANSRGSGDVIEVLKDVSTTMKIGYYMVHRPVNGNLLYDTSRMLYPGSPYLNMNPVYVQTPSPDEIKQTPKIFLGTPASQLDADAILPAAGATKGKHTASYYVPLYNQTTAAIGCAKLEPLTSKPIHVSSIATDEPNIIGYGFNCKGVGIVGEIDANDPTMMAPFFKEFTLTIPKGNYSPSDITTLLNKQLSTVQALGVEPVNNSSGGDVTYPKHTPLKTVFSGAMQTYTDNIPESVDCLIGMPIDPHYPDVNEAGQHLNHWFFNQKVNAELDADYYEHARVRLSKNKSPFYPFTLGGLTPQFQFDADNSRFTFTGLHQSFSQMDFQELAYAGTQTLEFGANSQTTPNRLSLAAQAALGVDYSRNGGVFGPATSKDSSGYAAPTQADGTDAMCVVGMMDPSQANASHISHWNGAFVLSWYNNPEELEFWNILGFSNSTVVKASAVPIEGVPSIGGFPVYKTKDVFDQYSSSHTDERIDDALFLGRYPNTVGNTIYEPPFQQTFSMQMPLAAGTDLDPQAYDKTKSVPLFRGMKGDSPPKWTQIKISSSASLYNHLVRIYYWWFAPPFFTESSTPHYAPMGENMPGATNTRFVVSTKHEPLVAQSLPRKLVFPDLLLTSDLPISPYQRYILSSGQPCNVLATLSKTYDTGDFFTSNSPGPMFTINEEFTLSRLSFKLINPDGSDPTNLSGSIFIRVAFTVPPVQQVVQQGMQEEEEGDSDGESPQA